MVDHNLMSQAYSSLAASRALLSLDHHFLLLGDSECYLHFHLAALRRPSTLPDHEAWGGDAGCNIDKIIPHCYLPTRATNDCCPSFLKAKIGPPPTSLPPLTTCPSSLVRARSRSPPSHSPSRFLLCIALK